jgi:hypothetical protein
VIAAWAAAFMLDGGAHLMGRGDFEALVIAGLVLWLPKRFLEGE